MDVIFDEVEGVDQEVSEKFPKKYRVIQKKTVFSDFLIQPEGIQK